MKISVKWQIIFKIVFIMLVLITIGMFWYDEITYYFIPNSYNSAISEKCSPLSNVAVIRIYGGIVGYEKHPVNSHVQTSSAMVIECLNAIDMNDRIKAVIVEIDSTGGEPAAGEEICKALKRTNKPIVALIKGMGVSAAYEIAVGTDMIFASKFSVVGSIGITMSYLDFSEQNRYEGLIYQQLSAGKYKDMGDPDKSLTEEERALLMRDINKMHQMFIELVAENRGIEIERVEKLADGSTMLGRDAKEAGLIDRIGDIEDVKQYLSSTLQIDPILCKFEY
jgi:protease-4